VSSIPLQHNNNSTTRRIAHSMCARGLDTSNQVCLLLAVTPVTLQRPRPPARLARNHVKWGPIMEEARRPEPSIFSTVPLHEYMYEIDLPLFHDDLAPLFYF